MIVPFSVQIETGARRGERLLLPPTGLTIGRQPGNDLILDDPAVSRQHARIELRGKVILVADLDTANGTVINGQRIGGLTILQPGDTLQIGATTLRLLPEIATIAQDAASPNPQWQGSAGPGPRLPPRSNRLPLILGGIAAVFLLICVCGGASLIAITRSGPSDEARGGAPLAGGTSIPAGSGAPGGVGQSQPRPGYATGTILDERGRPITGGRLQAQLLGVSQAGEKIANDLPVDAAGRYQGKIPEGNYSVVARIYIAFGGQQFVFDLDPVGGKGPDQAARSGVVRDFRWKLAGLRPERSASETTPFSRYGFRVQFSSSDNCSPINPASNCKLPDDLRATVTFTPTGALIDGSQGQPVTIAATGAQLNRGFTADQDLPLANYRITIATVTGSATRPLLISASPSGRSPANPTATSADVIPEPDIGGIHVVTVRVAAGP